MKPQLNRPQQLKGPHFQTQFSVADLLVLVELVRDDEVDLEKFAVALEERPTIGFLMQRRANSVELGGHEQPRTLRHALAILGLRRIREILVELISQIPENRSRAAS